MIGHFIYTVVRRIADVDTTGGRCRDVDAVHADAVPPDYLQARGSRQHGVGDRGILDEQGVRIGDAGGQHGGVTALDHMDLGSDLAEDLRLNGGLANIAVRDIDPVRHAHSLPSQMAALNA